MSYVSLVYLGFVTILVILYYIIPPKIRWVVLLIGSGIFYCYAISQYLQLILFFASIVISYLLIWQIEHLRKTQKKQWVMKCTLALGILLAIVPLFVPKIYDLFYHSGMELKPVSWIIPIGLSFYALQIVGYMVDVYQGKVERQKNLLKYSLFISFFPQIIQGPIPRYEQLGRQLFEPKIFDMKNIMRGIQLVLWGLVLKFLIADKAAVIVNEIIGNSSIYSGMYFWVAAILYSIQLYTDFQSCVLLSQGVAKFFGIDLIDNFKRPYFATSIKDFWHRWHISLSLWLRDYVYIPLGGSRASIMRKYLNLLLTFLVSGIWHGNYLTFIVWGLFHGILEILEDFFSRFRRTTKVTPARRSLNRIVTCFLVMIAWLVFRAESLKQAWRMLCSMFTTFNPWVLMDDSLFRLGLGEKEWFILILSIFILFVVSALQEKGVALGCWISKQIFVMRWAIYLSAIWSVWVFGTYGYGFNVQDFLYAGF